MPANSFCVFCGKRQPGKDARDNRGHVAVSTELIAKLDARADAEGRTRHDVFDELLTRALNKAEGGA